ncbi:Transmembrane protein, partial [Fragariocoptes setiger]
MLGVSLSQLVLVFVFSKILNRLTSGNFFYKWLARHKPKCYISPTDRQLRNLSSKNQDDVDIGDRERRLRSHLFCSKEFKINTDDISQHMKSYDSLILKPNELYDLVFGAEVEWVADLTLVSFFGILITELQTYLTSSNEYNLSLVWAIVVIAYCIRLLGKLTWAFFKTDQSIGERSVCITSGCIFLLLSMMILMIMSDNILEFKLNSTLGSIHKGIVVKTANKTVHDLETETRAGWTLFLNLIMAICCAFFGVLFTFPGLRFGQMHKMLLEKHEHTPIFRILCHVNYLSSSIVTVLSIDFIRRRVSIDAERSIGLTLSQENFDTLKIYTIITFGIIKVLMLPQYLQSYLRLSEFKMSIIKRRGTTISNLQVHANFSKVYESALEITIFQDLMPSIQVILSPATIRAFLGFACWWLHFAWFCTSSIGIVYHSYFTTTT